MITTPQHPMDHGRETSRKLPGCIIIGHGAAVIRFKASNATRVQLVENGGGILASVPSNQGWVQYPVGYTPDYLLVTGPGGQIRVAVR